MKRKMILKKKTRKTRIGQMNRMEKEMSDFICDIFHIHYQDISTLKSKIIEAKRCMDIVQYMTPNSKILVKTDEPCLIVCPNSSLDERNFITEKLKEIGFDKFFIVNCEVSQIITQKKNDQL